MSPGAGSSTNPRPSCQPRTVSGRERPAAACRRPLERDRVDEQVPADPVADGAPPDPAVVDRAPGRRPTGPPRSKPDDREDVEDVEGVDGWAPSGALSRASARPSPAQTRPEARLDRAPERPRPARLPAGRCRASTPRRRARRAGRRCRSSARSARGTARRPRTLGELRGSAADRRRRRPHRAARRRRPGRSSRAGSGRTRSGRTEPAPGRRGIMRVELRGMRRPAASPRPGARRDRTATRRPRRPMTTWPTTTVGAGSVPLTTRGQDRRDRRAEDEHARDDASPAPVEVPPARSPT